MSRSEISALLKKGALRSDRQEERADALPADVRFILPGKKKKRTFSANPDRGTIKAVQRRRGRSAAARLISFVTAASIRRGRLASIQSRIMGFRLSMTSA